MKTLCYQQLALIFCSQNRCQSAQKAGNWAKRHAFDMINYTPANQLIFEDFTTPFERGLDKGNRWVRLAELTPWDELAEIYASKLNTTKGKKSIDIRTILGALIIKHKTRTSDREVLDMIVESPYLQFFCGYRSFSHRKPFDSSLFVAIRDRMGVEEFKGFNRIIIQKTQQLKGSTTRKRSKQILSKGDDDCDDGEITHKSSLKLDATVCDQQIKHPTDLGLLNTARKKTEEFIDTLYERSALEKKPRTYRREAAKAYMAIAKKKQKSRKEIRKGIKQQLQYLRRNLGYLEHMLKFYDERDNPLSKKQLRQLWVISEVCRQQKYMHDNNTHRIADRIVSIFQPWVRPIVRGKEKYKTEFGAKINVSEIDGFAVIDQFRWDSYNEATCMTEQVENYKEQFGFYHELVLADRIYMNQKNRAWLKERDIRHGGVPLGRRPKE